jgi:pyridoxine kinase
LKDLAAAITAIHQTYSVPHVVVTSVQLSSLGTSTPPSTLTVIGSTTRSDGSPRLFRIDVPALDCFFSGTGDMFAALTVARLREIVFSDPSSSSSSSSSSLRNTRSWVSPDDVPPTELPLAKATERVLASMQSILEKTLEARNAELSTTTTSTPTGDTDNNNNNINISSSTEERQKREHLRRTKASEVRLIRNVHLLRNPVIEFQVQEWPVTD